MDLSKHGLRRLFFDGFVVAYLVLILWHKALEPSSAEMLEVVSFFYRFVFLFVLGLVLSEILVRKGFYTLGEVLFQADHKKAQMPELSFFKSLWGWQLTLLMALTFWIGGEVTKASLFELFDADGFAGVARLFGDLTSPNWSILPLAIVNIVETIFMAFLATTLAIPFAFVLSFLCAKNIMRHPLAFVVYTFLRTLLNVTRSIEALIWAIIFSVWVGIGPFAGMLALMIHSIASLAKQYSEMVESVQDGPIEGIESTGANALQVVWFAIVPQVILPYISFTVYRWDINVRMATIIGLVGGGGIGTMLMKYQGQAMWPEVGTIILVIAIVVWAMDQASAIIRESLK